MLQVPFFICRYLLLNIQVPFSTRQQAIHGTVLFTPDLRTPHTAFPSLPATVPVFWNVSTHFFYPYAHSVVASSTRCHLNWRKLDTYRATLGKRTVLGRYHLERTVLGRYLLSCHTVRQGQAATRTVRQIIELTDTDWKRQKEGWGRQRELERESERERETEGEKENEEERETERSIGRDRDSDQLTPQNHLDAITTLWFHDNPLGQKLNYITQTKMITLIYIIINDVLQYKKRQYYWSVKLR